MSIETNNTDLRIALTQQRGEGAARMTVEKEGKPVPYESLEKMTVRDLRECSISSFGLPVKVSCRMEFLSSRNGEYGMEGGPCGAGTYFRGDEKASRALEMFYQLGIAILTRESTGI